MGEKVLAKVSVLILIPVEDTLREVQPRPHRAGQAVVLILIPVEDTLRVTQRTSKGAHPQSLNPYSSGRYSPRED